MTQNLNRRLFLAGATVLAGAGAIPALAKRKAKVSPATGPWSGVRTMINSAVETKYVPGAGAAMARGAGPATFITNGVLHVGSTVAVTPDTLWRCYSMTKPITGMAAMMLIEDGKLKMDQNIADLIPAFANPRVLIDGAKSLESRPSKTPITVRSLLTHTAGLGYAIITKGPLLGEYERLGLSPGVVSKKKLPGQGTPVPTAPSLAEFADRLASLPLIADPGVRWSYSVSLDLLGRVIEIASGMTFDAFVQKRILDPLGMTSTFWQVPLSEKGRMTSNYFASPFGKFELDPAADSIYYDKPAFPFGGSGLVTTMRDYDRFLAMIMGNGAVGQTRIMKEETVRAALTNLVHPETIMDGLVKGQGYGAGGRVTLVDVAGGAGAGTYGWGGAASTVAWVDPKRSLRASAWSQMMTRGEQPFSEDFKIAAYTGL